MRDMRKIVPAIIIFAIALACLVAAKIIENSNKHFSGVRVVFFNGGSPDCPFASIVHRGARAAENDLGCKVEHVWSDWVPSKMMLQFKEAIARSPDAICMMGHPGTDVLSPLIDEAVRKGIIVTLQNVDLPEIRKQYIDKGCGYAGQELYSSGMMLARGAVRKFGLNKKDRALVIGYGITENKQALNERAMRAKGCIDGLEKEGLTVQAASIPMEVNKDTSLGFEFLKNLFAMYPDIKLLVIDHGGLTAAAGPILKKLGKRPGEIIVVGFDLSKNTVESIQSGYIRVINDQQPYLQGYLPVLQVCLAKRYGFAGLYIDTGVELIDSSNIGRVAELAKQKIR
jgi:simple sugar transport system substrate-binding protein